MVKAKIHMRCSVEYDTQSRKKTLCGMNIEKNTKTTSNPDGKMDVTCKKCLAIIDSADENAINGCSGGWGIGG